MLVTFMLSVFLVLAKQFSLERVFLGKYNSYSLFISYVGDCVTTAMTYTHTLFHVCSHVDVVFAVEQ